MAEFRAFNPHVEVNKRTVLSIVDAIDKWKEKRLKVLLDNGINPDDAEWFNQQKWLNAFKDISTKFGGFNLFLIGKTVVKNVEFPPIENLEQGLASVDIAYHMNHRLDGQLMFNSETGKVVEGIGNYKLESFDSESKTAVMICDNPYPSKFDEGIITQIVKKFKPGFGLVKVELDPTKETRMDGGDSCTFLISW